MSARSPEPAPTRTPPWRRAAAAAVPALLAGTLYLATAQLAQLLDDPGRVGAVFWPGAGVTVTALLVTPRRRWFGILVAVALAEASSVALQGYGLPLATLFWMLGNTVEPLLVALVLRNAATGTLRRSAVTLRFVAATAAACTVGGLLGAVGTTLVGSTLPYGLVVLRWAIGDGLGVLTVVPFGLLLCGRLDRGRGDLRELTRPASQLALLLSITVAVVVFLPVFELSRLPVAFLVLAPMVWIAGRLGLATTAVAVFVVAQIANVGTALGHGPFGSADTSALTASTLSQLYIAVTTVTVLLLASSRAETATFEDLAATREQLIAAVSHELRTPLTPILGFSELLLERSRPDARDRQSLEVIHRNAGHLTRVVDELLQLTRARRAGLSADPVAVDVAEVARQLTGDHAAALTVHSPATAWVDPTHLAQVLTNLLSNAARYGRPPVEVHVSGHDDLVEVVVRDHGDGVPAGFEDRMFDEFAQAQVGDRRTASGLGLGLSIARDLARTNDGELRYAPAEPGARFTLRLPHAPATRSPDLSRASVHGIEEP